MDSADRRQRATEEAAEWLLRLRAPGLSRTERAEYIEWLCESPLHVAEMLQVGGVHRRLTEFPGWRLIPRADRSALADAVVQFPAGGEGPVACRGTKLRRHPWRWAGGIAVGAAVLLVTLWFVLLSGSQTFDTGAGERRDVKLPDGSVVQLSPRTTIHLRYTDSERGVMLARGDALFRVAKNAARPFVVQTDHTRVRAVGTAFAVEHDDGSVVVTVEEGRVAVVHSTDEMRMPALQPAPVTEVSLGANQQIVVPRAGPMGVVRKVDSRRELAWADGRLIFDSDPVSAVVRQFNRFNRVQIELRDPQLAARHVSAVFDASDPEAFVVFLESVTNVRVTRPSSDRIVIDSEGPN